MASPSPSRPPVALASNSSSSNADCTDWWMYDIRIKILDLIYSSVVTLGEEFESALLDPSNHDRLLNDPKLDTAIRQVYKQLRLPRPQGTLRSRTDSEWNNDKRKILECLVPLQRDRPSYEIELRQFTKQHASRVGNDPWTPLRVSSQEHVDRQPPQSYNTPAETPASLPPRASSESGRRSVASDRTATRDDPQPRASEHAPFSPAESFGGGGSRRRRSSSTMQSEKPGKRARGPQEHICQVCNKKFPFLSKLNDHMKTHSTQKDLRCHLCKKSFKRTREVNAHLKTVHKIENHHAQLPSTSSPAATPMHPATPPVSLLPPTTSFPPTPVALSLPHPRPSPRAPQFLGQYTPQPTPEHFNEPTPTATEPEYRDTPSAFTPRTIASEDETMRDREESNCPDEMEIEGRENKENLGLVGSFQRFDINRDEPRGTLDHLRDPKVLSDLTLPPLVNINYPPVIVPLPRPKSPEHSERLPRSQSPAPLSPAAIEPGRKPADKQQTGPSGVTEGRTGSRGSSHSSGNTPPLELNTPSPSNLPAAVEAHLTHSLFGNVHEVDKSSQR